LITKVQAYTSRPSAPTLALTEPGREATDPIQITNIDGLDPVKASAITTPYGTLDGESFDGIQVPSRNIVLTLRPNPDWTTWSPEDLRQLIYAYFMPKNAIKLIFTSDELDPVEIDGVIDGVEANPFSQDPEFLVSLICVDPYFQAVTETVVTGTTIRPGGTLTTITNDGNIEVGIRLTVTYVSGSNANSVQVQSGDPSYTTFDVEVEPEIQSSQPFDMCSIPTKKFARIVYAGLGLPVYLTHAVAEGSVWPTLKPGDNDIGIVTPVGVQNWELRFFERYGGF
jgi:hypothetical protein